MNPLPAYREFLTTHRDEVVSRYGRFGLSVDDAIQSEIDAREVTDEAGEESDDDVCIWDDGRIGE